MPGVLKDNFSSSSSETGSFTDNGLSGGAETSYKDGSYPAASYPGYSEKPLNEQLEPIAVCGMGTSMARPFDTD
jgi:hypothetical protein